MTDIIVEERSKLPIGYTSWKPILRINYDTLKKVKKHAFKHNLRIRVEKNEKKCLDCKRCLSYGHFDCEYELNEEGHCKNFCIKGHAT